MFRKITSTLADPDLPNYSVSAILGGVFGAAAFLAYARADGLLTSTLSTMCIGSMVWATNQFKNGNRNHQVFFQPVEHTPADLNDIELGYSTAKKAC